VDILIGLLLLAACIGFFWGVFKLFRKGQRRRGLIYVAASFCALMASASLVGVQNERDAKAAGFASYAEQQEADAAEQGRLEDVARAQRLQQAREEQEQLDATARGLGYNDYDEQLRAELEAQQEDERANRQAVLGDFPSAAVKNHASELGIARYTAYQQLRNIDAIRAYCTFYAESWRAEEEKQAQIDAGGDEVALTANAEATYISLRDRYNAEFNLIDFEVTTLSTAGHWLTYCNAFEKGWGVFGANSAGRADREFAGEAQDILTAIFTNELERNSASNEFNSQSRAIINCRHENIDNKWYVGCRVRSLASTSSWRIFLIGRSDNGRRFFSPLNGPSITTLEAIWPTIPADLRNQISAANFAGPRLPISKVLAEFE